MFFKLILENANVDEIGFTLVIEALEDAATELHRMEEVQNTRQEMNRTKDEAV